VDVAASSSQLTLLLTTLLYSSSLSVTRISVHLVEESNNLSSHVFPSRFFMIHDTCRGREDYVPELSRWQKLDDPFLKVTEANVVTRRDDTGLVQSAVRLDLSSPHATRLHRRTGH